MNGRVARLTLAPCHFQRIDRQPGSRMVRPAIKRQGRELGRAGSLLLVGALMAGLNIVGAYLVKDAVGAGQRAAAEQRGLVVVGTPFLQQMQEADSGSV